MIPLIVGHVRGWVHHPDGTVTEDSLLVTATEFGVSVTLASCAIGLLAPDAAELADLLAEAAAAAENLRRAADAGRQVAMREHAREMVESLGLTWGAT